MGDKITLRIEVSQARNRRFSIVAIYEGESTRPSLWATAAPRARPDDREVMAIVSRYKRERRAGRKP